MTTNINASTYELMLITWRVNFGKGFMQSISYVSVRCRWKKDKSCLPNSFYSSQVAQHHFRTQLRGFENISCKKIKIKNKNMPRLNCAVLTNKLGPYDIRLISLDSMTTMFYVWRKHKDTRSYFGKNFYFINGFNLK